MPIKKSFEFSTDVIFEDRTNQYFESPIIAQKIYLVDLNRDGYTDIVTLKEKYSSPTVYFFDPASKMFKVAKYSIFPRGFRASFLYFDDFNQDKLVDAVAGQFFMNVEYNVPPSQLLFGKKEKGIFKFEVNTNITNKKMPNSTILPIDVDQDGQLEFLNAFWIGNKNGINQFFPIEFFSPSGFSVEVEDNKNLIYRTGSASWAAELCDLNNDSFVDILVANTSGYENYVLLAKRDNQMASYSSGHQKYSMLIKDSEGSGFILGNGNTLGYLCADFNNDGLLDVISYEEKRELQDQTRDPIRIHYQHGVKHKNYPFSSLNFPIGLKNYSIKSVIDFDYDNDGDTDLLLENTGYPPFSKLMLFENKNGDFFDITNKSGLEHLNPSGTNVIDLDGDGILEIIVGQSQVRAGNLSGNLKIYQQISPKKETHRIEIYLQGKQSNPTAIGATLVLTTKKWTKKTMVNYVRGGNSIQRSRGLNFSLGDQQEVFVKIDWPIKKGKTSNHKIEFKPGEYFKQVSICDDGRFLNGKLSCKF